MTTFAGTRWLGRLLTLCGAALLVAACTTPDLRLSPRPPQTATPRSTFPVAAVSGIASLSLAGASGSEQLTSAELTRLDAFIQGFRSNGRGQLTVAVPAGGNETTALARGRQIVERATARGLQPDEVLLRLDTGAGSGGQLVASYESFTAVVPECGDWSKESSFDPYNTDHGNYGCSIQRGAAQIIANPADIAHMRAAGSSDVQRNNAAIQKYRSLKSTTTPFDAVESVRTIPR
ncbi:MAG: CpaD family pilus assembly lipoprotein [Alphaproteobacteria bacterium]